MAQHLGGDEVDGALAPPRALNQKYPLAFDDDPANDIELVGAEPAGGVAGETSQQPQCLFVDRFGALIRHIRHPTYDL